MTDSSASPGQASRRATLGLLVLILLLLIWYLLADRLTPYSSQARVQAFVVPVAAEVSGQIKQVYVRDNQDVEAGTPLFEIDAEPYDIALAKARSDYQTVLSGVRANSEGVKAAEAALMAMRGARWRQPRPTCAAPSRPPGRTAITTPSCSAPVRRYTRPSWIARTPGWWRQAAVSSRIFTRMQASLSVPVPRP